MRFVSLIVLLGLVGLAAWLLLEKFRARPAASSSALPATQVEAGAPIEITDSEAAPESTEVSPPAQLKPKPQTQPPATQKPAPVSKPRTLAYYYAQGPNCALVEHTYYALCYREEAEQPAWTVYVLTAENLKQGTHRRTQDFRPDPKVATGSADLSDYRKSGYDRGHLVPAGDFKWDPAAMSETFYLSNMSPQLHEFNAGIWERVESTVRSWARRHKRLLVYTGPVLDKPKEHIGANRVAVPRAFYKVVYAIENEKSPQALAFLVPHAPSQRDPLEFLVPVDSVEKVTGIDFFPALPDPVEEAVEARVDRRFWAAPATGRKR